MTLLSPEDQARRAKAEAIADALRAAECSSGAAASMTHHERMAASLAAFQHTPSDTTWALVVERLRFMERGHETTVTEGGPGDSNYVVRCSCGKVINVATTHRAYAKRVAERHVDAYRERTTDEIFDDLERLQ